MYLLVDYELLGLGVVIMNGVGRKKSYFSTSLFDFGFDYVAKA